MQYVSRPSILFNFSLFTLLILLIMLIACSDASSRFGFALDRYSYSRTFWAINFEESYQEKVSAVLIAEGQWCDVYMDDQEDRYSFDQIVATGRQIADFFDQHIYKPETDIYGNPSDVDENGKILLFLHDIQDGFDEIENPTYIGGYFNPLDLYPDSILTHLDLPHSNQGELLYADTHQDNPFDGALSEFLSTLSHEFYHLLSNSFHVLQSPDYAIPANKSFTEDQLNHNFNLMEEEWLEEGMAELATDIVFHTVRSNRLMLFSETYNIPLNWESPVSTEPANPTNPDEDSIYTIEDWEVIYGYSSSYLFCRFLADVYGSSSPSNPEDSIDYSVMSTLFSHTYRGLENIDEWIRVYPKPDITSLEDLYHYWMSAVIKNSQRDQFNDQAYRFTSISTYIGLPYTLASDTYPDLIRPNACLLFNLPFNEKVQFNPIPNDLNQIILVDDTTITNTPIYQALTTNPEWNPVGDGWFVLFNFTTESGTDTHWTTQQSNLSTRITQSGTSLKDPPIQNARHKTFGKRNPYLNRTDRLKPFETQDL